MGYDYFPPFYDLNLSPEENTKALRRYTEKYDKDRRSLNVMLFAGSILMLIIAILYFIIKSTEV